MKLSEFKNHLTGLNDITILLPDGKPVPSSFHVTEIGQLSKSFIDCGGTIRSEKTVSIQLWQGSDRTHRLVPQKLNSIISLSENKLNIQDAEIEVEYQGESISKFGLEFNGKEFLLTKKNTACLASDSCGNTSQLMPTANSSASCCGSTAKCC